MPEGAVTSQPGAAAVGVGMPARGKTVEPSAPEDRRGWSTNIFGCCADCGTCRSNEWCAGNNSDFGVKRSQSSKHDILKRTCRLVVLSLYMFSPGQSG